MPVRRGHVLEDAVRAVRRKQFPFNFTLKVLHHLPQYTPL